MTNCTINKLELLNLSEKYKFIESDNAVMEVVSIIELKLNVKIKQPISEKLRAEIKSKLITLNNSWKKLTNLHYKDMYRREIEKRTLKIRIPSYDLSEDSLKSKFEVMQEEFNDTKAQNCRLEKSIKELNAELFDLKCKLHDSQTKQNAKQCVHPTIQKTPSSLEQTSTISTIDFQEKLKGKKNTIKNILLSPDIIELDSNETNRPCTSSSNSKLTISKIYNMTSSPNSFATFLACKNNLDSEVKPTKKINSEHFPNLTKLTKLAQRKNYYLVSERQKIRLKMQIKGSILESTTFLKSMGLCLGSVEINPIELEDPDIKIKINLPNSEKREDEQVEKLLYYKDKHSISDKCYCDLRTKCSLEVPSLFKLIRFRNKIDSMFTLHNNEMGVFMSVEDKLRYRLEQFFKRKYPKGINDPETNFKDPIIHVKLGADGTNIGRNLKLLNFTFTLINEGAKSKTANGNYTLGIFEIETENYNSVTESFKELIEEFANLNTIKIDNKELKVVYYYAGDWKMLANCLGIQGANSKYPCVWCKCAKENFYNLKHEWSIIDTKLGARTHEEQAAILAHPKIKEIVSYGYTRTPIFKDIIPISRYMIDMLHLFLRISDTLFNLLVKDCSLADNFDMGSIYKFDVSLYKHMNSLQHFLNEKCNVKFSFYWIAETKKLTWRDLVGPEKVRLFENMNMSEIIPDHEKFDAVSKIWSDFYIILRDVKEVNIEAADLKNKTADWLTLFLTVYNKTTVTPYMHAFVFHLHEFVHLYKDINAFNCQGLEKLNDISTQHYFKSTNKGPSSLHQMLKKRNRMEYLSQFLISEENE